MVKSSCMSVTMVRSRQIPQQHEHCAKCYDAHCQVPVKIGVSCPVIKCRKGCGAVLHMCKEDEHRLLCRDEKVHCLNAGYGCPFTMLRHRLAKHLEVCPASVVCCSQEWIRWPVCDGTDMAFYRNVSGDPQGEGPLDVAMALRDQELLFGSIKMKDIFPELIEEFEGPPLHDMAVGGARCEDGGASGSGCCVPAGNACAAKEDRELSREERDAIAKNKDVKNIQKYSSWEGMFRKEMQGCEETVKNLDTHTDHGGAKEGKDPSVSQEETRPSPVPVVDLDAAAGTAPWQDGVLAKVREELTLREYNSYLVHNGPMLIHFDQLPACTPREMDFVYGGLEPIEVQTVRTFNIPTSYRAKRNHLMDPAVKVKTERQSVDTSDLGVPTEELPKSDEISATLLCALEKELKGHPISETTASDGFYVDIGTQTYDFASAPFRANMSLADVAAADRPGALHVRIQTESVTRRHNKMSSAFSRDCGRFFRRDEYRSHFRNVHSDIQAGLDGWFQQRCPLAYLGCTYSQCRFHPCRQQATVRYCTDLGTFALQPAVPLSLHQGGDPLGTGRGERARDADALARLPFEILQHIASYLDGFTLRQLSQVSMHFREVCGSLLQGRGMVSLKWEKKTYSRGGTSWRCLKKVWEFSCVFSSVDRWCFNNDVPSMSEHLKVCSFYERDDRTEPVALPRDVGALPLR